MRSPPPGHRDRQCGQEHPPPADGRAGTLARRAGAAGHQPDHAHRHGPPSGTGHARTGSGQLVFISSSAAWHGLPSTPTYSASKAAIKAYGEGLRGLLAPAGIGVTVVMPGYVTSPMCNAMPGPKPWSGPRNVQPASLPAASLPIGHGSAFRFRSISAPGGWPFCPLRCPNG